MIKKLHRQLTAICALCISIILLFTLFTCLFISESGMRSKNFLNFQNNVNGMLTYLEEQSVITYSWLARIEHSYHLSVEILDNGAPLLYSSLQNPAETTRMFERARAYAAQQYGLDGTLFQTPVPTTRHQEFSLKDDRGALWYAGVAILPKNGTALCVTTLCSNSELHAQIVRQRFLFSLGGAAAIILLTLLFHFIIGRTLRPVEENRRRQVEFVAAASHELRSPLAVMLTSLGALRLSAGIHPNSEKTEASHFADTIEHEGRRMSRLIDDMLTLASADNSSWSIRKTKVAADTLLLQIYETYEPLVRGRKHVLQIDLPDDPLPPLFCDAERIAQLLGCLIDNALSYSPEGTAIRLSLRSVRPRDAKKSHFTGISHALSSLGVSSGEVCEISVIDHGCGIPDEKKASVFERFYRTDQSHSDRRHFGLGLCIAKEIADLHKGLIRVTDTPGGGATFILLLPFDSE